MRFLQFIGLRSLNTLCFVNLKEAQQKYIEKEDKYTENLRLYGHDIVTSYISIPDVFADAQGNPTLQGDPILRLYRILWTITRTDISMAL